MLGTLLQFDRFCSELGDGVDEIYIDFSPLLEKNVFVCDSYGTCKGICGRMYHLHSYWDFLACSVIEIIYCILIYTVLQADRLYTMVIVQVFFSRMKCIRKNRAKSLLRMFIQAFLALFRQSLFSRILSKIEPVSRSVGGSVDQSNVDLSDRIDLWIDDHGCDGRDRASLLRI